MTKSIIKAVQKGEPIPIALRSILTDAADVRAIIAKGWSSRGGDPAKEGGNIEFPDSCFGLEKVPHGWLFPRGTFHLSLGIT
jgi:sterol 3beta-glucosyltransferase